GICRRMSYNLDRPWISGESACSRPERYGNFPERCGSVDPQRGKWRPSNSESLSPSHRCGLEFQIAQIFTKRLPEFSVPKRDFHRGLEKPKLIPYVVRSAFI